MKIIKPHILLIFFLNIFFKSNSQTINQIFDEGLTLKKSGNCLSAIEKFNKILSIDKNYYDAWYEKAECLFLTKKYDEAIETLNNLLKINSKHIKGRLLKAKILITKNKNTEAIEDLKKILLLDDKNLEALELLIIAYLKFPDKKNTLINELLKAKALNSKNPLIYYKLSEHYKEKKQYEQALENINTAIKLDSNSYEFYFFRATINYEINNCLEVIKDLSNLIKRNFVSEKILEIRADCALRLKQYEIALSDYSRILSEFNKNKVEIYIRRGKIYSLLDNPQKAINDYSKAIYINPTVDSIYLMRAEEYLKLGKSKINLAIKDLKKVIELNSNNYKAFLKLGILHIEKKRFYEALQYLDKSIKINPTAEAYFYRGAIYYEMNDLKNSCLDLQKAKNLGYEKAQEILEKFCMNFNK